MTSQQKYNFLTKFLETGSGNEIEDHNPADGETLASLSALTKGELKDIIGELISNSEWGISPAPYRGKILFKAGEIMENEKTEIARLMTDEEGKTINDSLFEVERSANTLKFYGAETFEYGGITLPSADSNTRILTQKEPLGLVALISPWNFPLSIPVWKLAPALASGNLVLLKPASKTPLIVAKLAEILQRAGLPEGVLKIIIGSGNDIGKETIQNENVDAISFTGSIGVGKDIYKIVGNKKKMTRIQLELGGKNAMYIDKESDLKKGSEFAVRSAFGLTGQSCTATSRLLVHSSVYDQFMNLLEDRTKDWKIGPGTDTTVNSGPVVDRTQLSTDMNYIRIGLEEGAKLTYGGENREGTLYLQPTIFEEVDSSMKIFNEEIFGPILSVTKVDSLEEAIELTNKTEYGHTAAIISNNNTTVNKFVNSITAGVIKINKPTVGLEVQAPFGAFKSSGANTWKEMGARAMDFYTKEKTIYLGF